MCDKDDLVENVKKNIKTPKMDKIDILKSLVGKKLVHPALQTFSVTFRIRAVKSL